MDMEQVQPKEKVISPFFPAEWYPQSGILLTWPHKRTSWASILKEVEACYVALATEIAKRQLLLIVTPHPEEVHNTLSKAKVNLDNVRFSQCNTNDTWARDHGPITLLKGEQPRLLDFMFNGWGLKFAANWDNLITECLFEKQVISGDYINCRNFVLEGGAIESDGEGTLLTTSHCMLAPNRNDTLGRQAIEDYLMDIFYLKRVLWLDYGYLEGDDTDSHIDTLARFCNPSTIAYVQCTDKNDTHYVPLQKMEEQLKTFKQLNGEPYNLVPLPLPDAIYLEGYRLPATYANFLIMNEAVLYPTYDQKENDAKAKRVLEQIFPNHEIIGINCLPLIKEHGSLHCVTMQFPKGILV
ncbi:MAG: agmatine deiminase family protein [Bacteroidales bacterium]|nr:agmatine deiminase family protein [Bacteroidales bacterium]